jgi:hypothetical protein
MELDYSLDEIKKAIRADHELVKFLSPNDPRYVYQISVQGISVGIYHRLGNRFDVHLYPKDRGRYTKIAKSTKRFCSNLQFVLDKHLY